MKKARSLKVSHSEAGASLVQIIIGLAVMSIVAFSAAHMSADVKKAEIFGDVSNSISQIHLISLQKSKNATLLQSALETNAGLDFGAAGNFSKCLSGAGENCLGFRTNNFQNLPLMQENATVSDTLDILSRIEYKIECSSNSSCESFLLRVQTRLSNDQVRRSTDIRVSGRLFGVKPEISFSCSDENDQIVTGVDFATRKAVCEGMKVTTNGCGGSPLNDLDAGSSASCTEMTTINCARGIKKIGLIDSQGACL